MSDSAQPYRVPRDFTVCDTVGFCATTVDGLVESLFALPTETVSAAVNLVGVPGVVSAHDDPEIAAVYDAATMVVVDGMPLVKAARRLGLECERCAAPDFMTAVLDKSVHKGATHFFYGGKSDEVLERLRVNLETAYPGIRIVGMYSPPFRPLTVEEDATLCAEVNSLRPDFLWVGIGAPKQEKWIQAHREGIHGTVMLGVGAGFDFLAGTLDKAPKWMEGASLEWLYRLFKEPKRLWRRYVVGGAKWLAYGVGHKPRLLGVSSVAGGDAL